MSRRIISFLLLVALLFAPTTEARRRWVPAISAGIPESDVFSADNVSILADTGVRSADGGFTLPVVIPTDLAGLKLWLTDNGAAAGTWPDSSGLSNDAVQATGANQPAIVAGVINGKQVRRFDGTNDFLTLTSSIPLTSLTFLVVYKCPGNAPHGDLQYITGSVSDAGLGLSAPGTTISLLKSFETTIVTSTGSIVNAWHVVAVTYSSPDGKIYIDGQLNASAASAQTFGNSTRIGQSGIGGLYSLNADVAEFIVYNRVLLDTLGERQGLENYLGSKYGITITH